MTMKDVRDNVPEGFEWRELPNWALAASDGSDAARVCPVCGCEFDLRDANLLAVTGNSTVDNFDHMRTLRLDPLVGVISVAVVCDSYECVFDANQQLKLGDVEVKL